MEDFNNQESQETFEEKSKSKGQIIAYRNFHRESYDDTDALQKIMDELKSKFQRLCIFWKQ